MSTSSSPISRSVTEDNAAGALDARLHLAFRLGKEEYAIDILRVQEIRTFEQPTCLPNTEPCVLGVLNLRGIIVPIVDLRRRFVQSAPKYDAFTVVIMVDTGHRVVGVVVDAVSDVVAVGPDQLRPMPALGTTLDGDCLQALASLPGRTIVLVDIVKLLNAPGMGLGGDIDLSVDA